MFDIVANKRNGLDVDKFDYLNRDQVSMGIQCGSFNSKRIIKNSRVINNQICFNQKIYLDLRSVFEARYKLFKDCYLHRVCQAIDFMIVDALLEANDVFKFHENLHNPEVYVNYTDNILGLIECSQNTDLKKS